MLHNEVQGSKVARCNREDSVDPRKQGFVTHSFKIINKVVENLKQVNFLLPPQSFDDKSIVVGVKEERATLTSSFSSLKQLLSVSIERHRLQNVFWSNVVHLHNLHKLFLLMSDDLGFNIQLSCFFFVIWNFSTKSSLYVLHQ